MTVEVKYTYQDLLTTPDDLHRYELFEGDLVMTPAPNPAHQFAVSNLHRLLSNYAEAHNLGKLLIAPLDVYFDEETVVEPDILFVAKERLHIIDEQKVNGAPDVIIEVISPSTEQRDRGFKFKRYAQEGVKEYWIVRPDEVGTRPRSAEAERVDPTKKTIEIYELREKGFVLSAAFTNKDEVRSPYFQGLKFNLEEVWK